MRDDSKPRGFALTRLGCDELFPCGWLRERLELQAAGLGGRIDEVWPDLGPDSAWLGGKGESWERGPYWLDGLIPLAFLLEGRGGGPLTRKASRWIEALIASRRPDGSFGPPGLSDWWPFAVVAKALLAWREATGDGRAVELLAAQCRLQLALMDERPLAAWAAARGGESALAALDLWELTGEDSLLELARKCLDQSLPWASVFRSFPFPLPTGAYLSRALFLPYKAATLAWVALSGAIAARALGRARARPGPKPDPRKIRAANASKLNRAYHFTHNVNYAMAVKYPAVSAAVEAAIAAVSAAEGAASPAMRDAISLADASIEAALRYHGLPSDIWSGDEHFSGRDPTRGVELCGIVELMYSLERLIEITGESRYGDRLESLAFNALPAAFTRDMCAHQYLQQANQVAVTRAARPWYDNGREALLFGLAPEYGCCAANFHQGYPKLARSLWFRGPDGELACAVYASARISCHSGGRGSAGGPARGFEIEVVADYPRSGRVELRFRMAGGSAAGGVKARIPLLLRVPAWAEGALCRVPDGETLPMGPPGGFFRLDREFADGDALVLDLPLRVRVEFREGGSVCIRRGPLLFALPIEPRWKSLRGEPPFDYREALPSSPWNYALALDEDDPSSSFQAQQREGSLAMLEGEPPIVLVARGRRVASWGMKGASAGPVPASPIDPSQGLGPEIDLVLVPYACAPLRIAQFPWFRSGRGLTSP
ncbi:MAG: glycoside hydrolase family 127 protein [Spirochaetaceae bacterium]|nr:glycoside hydrolase family 127 protein [Spirochaetaceae bacterium]